MIDEKLKTFITVARNRSISQAAKEIYLSQPAVTTQIHKLEQAYKESLFYRREDGMELTPAGKILYEFALRINNLYEEAARELGVPQGIVKGTLHIGATLTIGEYLLPRIVGHFKLNYPHVDILLEIENTAKVVDKVAWGILDCGLVEGPFQNEGIRTKKLADDKLIVICSKKHEIENDENVDLDILCREPFILREPGSGTRQVFENALNRAGKRMSNLNIMMQLGSTQTIKSMVKEDVGITVLSERSVKNEIQQGVLRELKVPQLNLHRSFSFIFKKEINLSLITKKFVRICYELMEDTDTCPDLPPKKR